MSSPRAQNQILLCYVPPDTVKDRYISSGDLRFIATWRCWKNWSNVPMPKQKLVLKTWDFPFDRMLPAARGPNEVQNGTGVMLYADNAKVSEFAVDEILLLIIRCSRESIRSA